MKQIIENVLEDLTKGQLNFESKTARDTITKLVTSALRSEGTYIKNNEIKSTPNDLKLGGKVRELSNQIYREMTADGLPIGGDVEAVLESQRLAEEIVNGKNDDWIYESPDGGETVFRRKFEDYNPENKEHIDWETKEPTGKTFLEYPWHKKDER